MRRDVVLRREAVLRRAVDRLARTTFLPPRIPVFVRTRFSDSAAMAIIELVDRDVSAKGQDSGPVMVDETEEA